MALFLNWGGLCIDVLGNSSVVQLEPEESDAVEMGIQQIYSKKRKLAWVLTIILPLYTVNYLTAYGGATTPAQTIVVYQILSVLTKAFFASITMDIHVDLLESARRVLSEETFRHCIDEARRTFMKYISHELRTPLNSLNIGIEVLENCDDLNEGHLESLALMKDASTFMCDTLDNVMSIQKMEEGKLSLSMVPFSIGDAISKVKAVLLGGLLQKRVRLVVNKSPLVPEWLLGDRVHIEHVIGHFISNAVRFSPDGSEIVVDVSVEQRMGDRVTVLLVVTDAGPGISSEKQKGLFTNLVQMRPSKLQKGSGSGLGLTIAKQIVELHGGRIGVSSTEGHGSQFYFAIPFKITIECPDPPIQQPFADNQQVVLSILDDKWKSPVSPKPRNRSMQSATVSTRADLRVLVVDDSQSSLKMMIMLLKKLGVVKTDTAENGRIAVDMTMGASNPYQLVFMDNLMPEMNGVDAARFLRQQGSTVLIVGVTGNVMEEDIAEYLSAGADMVLPKPFGVRLLQNLLDFVSSGNGRQVVSRHPDCHLVEQDDNKLHWAPAVKAVTDKKKKNVEE
eukprot:gene29224-biopygen23711